MFIQPCNSQPRNRTPRGRRSRTGLSISAALLTALALVPVTGADTPGMEVGAVKGDAEARGLAVAEQMREMRRGFGGESSAMELVLINAAGDEVTRRMASRTLEMEDDGDRSRITFKWPADVEGTELLTWSHRQGADDQWLYLPAIQRVKRISSRNKSGSFMGSEFSYEDLGSQEVEQFTYRYLREEKLGGRDTVVIERYPEDKLSGYAKQVVWYDMEYGRPVQIHYFDRKEELLKISTFGDFRKLGQWWREHRIEMSNVQTHKRSVITWQSRTLEEEHTILDFERTALGD